MEDVFLEIIREYGANSVIIYLLYRIDRKLDLFLSKFISSLDRIIEKIEIVKYT